MSFQETALSADQADAVAHAAAVLRAGGLVGMPTETVYGLAADALDAAAVLRIFAAKGRPRFDPLIVHAADAEQAWTIAIPDARAELLAAACWPGPLTLILPRRDHIPDVVTAGLPTVAVRVPDHAIARALIRAAGLPLAAPSANPFGRISPTTAAHVAEQLGAAVGAILDGGPCRIGVESTVLILHPQPLILRPGGCPRERLAAVLGIDIPIAGRDARNAALPSAASVGLASPGLLASHYAPRIPLTLREPGAAWPTDPAIALLTFTGRDLPPHRRARILSRDGDLAAAATVLFAALRELDASGASAICAELVPDQGLGEAINDRLRRAAGLG